MVAWSDRKVIDVAISDAIKNYQVVEKDSTLVNTGADWGFVWGMRAD